jgi:hypothetical protein
MQGKIPSMVRACARRPGPYRPMGNNLNCLMTSSSQPILLPVYYDASLHQMSNGQ